MVLVGVVIDKKDEEKLIRLKVTDSKLLSPKQREALYDRILDVAKNHKTVIIPPGKIDDALNSETSNLNWLEADAIVTIIDALKPDTAIIDAPSNNIARYKAYLVSKLVHNAKLVLEHKADLTYPAVSAASIIAKVTRDRAIEDIKKHVGVNFGSGYMSDVRTKEFLEKNYAKFPDIFRKTWEPYAKLTRRKKQKSLEDY